ncbi:MAG: hypothetical protein V8Q17_01945 [Acutalibacteraceae bacterium]
MRLHLIQKSLPALGHKWTHTVTEPTCTQEGSNTMVCSVCHEQHTESIPATGHHLSTVTIEPTDTQDGSITTTCAFGDYQTTEILPKSETPVNLATSNQVSVLSESLATQLQVLRSYMSSSLSTPSASHGPNAVDAVFGTLSIGVIIAGGIILYPYFTLFQWVNKKKKLPLKIYSGVKQNDTAKLDFDYCVCCTYRCSFYNCGNSKRKAKDYEGICGINHGNHDKHRNDHLL